MSSSTTQTLTAPLQSLSLRGQSAEQTTAASATPAKTLAFRDDPDYKYRRFLPHHDPEFKLPPLEQFDHVDPGEPSCDCRLFHDGNELTVYNIMQLTKRSLKRIPKRSSKPPLNARSLLLPLEPSSKVFSYTSSTLPRRSSWRSLSLNVV